MFGKINKHSELCPTRGWKFVYALQSPKQVISRIYKMVSRDTAIPYRLTAFSSCIISISISTYSFTFVEKQIVKVFSTFIDCIYNRYIHLLYPIKKGDCRRQSNSSPHLLVICSLHSYIVIILPSLKNISMLFENVRFVKLCVKYMRIFVNNWMQHIYVQLSFMSVHLKSKHDLSAALYTRFGHVCGCMSPQRLLKFSGGTYPCLVLLRKGSRKPWRKTSRCDTWNWLGSACNCKDYWYQQGRHPRYFAKKLFCA